MARGGINKAVVQTARLAILARGENPSIDAVRIEMGNTGSKTTIHRYLKELDESETRQTITEAPIDDELSELVARLAQRLKEKAQEPIDLALAQFEQQKTALLAQLEALQAGPQPTATAIRYPGRGPCRRKRSPANRQHQPADRTNP